jgi:hypothetical protein
MKAVWDMQLPPGFKGLRVRLKTDYQSRRDTVLKTVHTENFKSAFSVATVITGFTKGTVWKGDQQHGKS